MVSPLVGRLRYSLAGYASYLVEVNEESATAELRTSQQRYLQIQCIIGHYEINVNLEMPFQSNYEG